MRNTKKMLFDSSFKCSFLRPKNFCIWLVIFSVFLLSRIPRHIRDPFLSFLGKVIGHFLKSAKRRAKINLIYCMPELGDQQRNEIIKKMFSIALQSIVLTAELAWCKRNDCNNGINWHGRDEIDNLIFEKRNVIIFVPHCFAIDIPGILLSSEGLNMVAIVRKLGNDVIDYVVNTTRSRFSSDYSHIYFIENGIKPFIKSVRQGYWGYYLPDLDYGSEQSHFVDFFATYKATLPALGRLMKICNATVVPIFPTYDSVKHQLDIYVRPPMDDLLETDEITQARRMNEEIETFIKSVPEQYNWILTMLKTRREGEPDPYKRTDL
ncbi:TPA: lauroyl-Kdo(2)-lipid IV(A) myristoyltransferase [Raoultella planticola]|nr:lauroyl-Kdo(2)-lipid IV(A) myristoyltransferase [Raoultella planticola]